MVCFVFVVFVVLVFLFARGYRVEGVSEVSFVVDDSASFIKKMVKVVELLK